MKKEAPVHFANTVMRAGKGFDCVPLHRQKDGPREPAARLDAKKRIPQLFKKKL